MFQMRFSHSHAVLPDTILVVILLNGLVLMVQEISFVSCEKSFLVFHTIGQDQKRELKLFQYIASILGSKKVWRTLCSLTAFFIYHPSSGAASGMLM